MSLRERQEVQEVPWEVGNTKQCCLILMAFSIKAVCACGCKNGLP